MNRQGATLRLRILDDDNPGYAHLAFEGGHDILRQQTLSLSVRSSAMKSFLGAAGLWQNAPAYFTATRIEGDERGALFRIGPEIVNHLLQLDRVEFATADGSLRVETVWENAVDDTLTLWDLATGNVLRTFTGHSSLVLSVAIAPDGRTALSGSSDNTLKLWDFATGTLLRTFTGHADGVSSVAVAPDGRTALSGSLDSTLKLWDLATGTPLHTFTGHTDAVRSVAIAPDGRTALSGSEDKTLKLWDLT
jgi:WD40 repeat protein